jgi:hypothetical protein
MARNTGNATKATKRNSRKVKLTPGQKAAATKRETGADKLAGQKAAATRLVNRQQAERDAARMARKRKAAKRERAASVSATA